ncbi:hypothetical protein Q9Q94_10330 [Uliginosibacterium sp. 31-16]|uniref:hypothetical protein n=1 Tax=Uliginosibacterium sp. 31-16 TaxID=3068315 RepID=UPI0027401DA8|nr:hypothetical protein [Uliginosibacterium sp. 31-16]MDP5239932.1 hypothetical protein [Uliginosibacterium sp. 31-16]
MPSKYTRKTDWNIQPRTTETAKGRERKPYGGLERVPRINIDIVSRLFREVVQDHKHVIKQQREGKRPPLARNDIAAPTPAMREKIRKRRSVE